MQKCNDCLTGIEFGNLNTRMVIGNIHIVTFFVLLYINDKYCGRYNDGKHYNRPSSYRLCKR